MRAMPRQRAEFRLSGGQRIRSERQRSRGRRVITGDHVERRGLSAAIGADQAVHLARLHIQIETVDCADVAEAQDDIAQAERLVARGLARDVAERGWARYDGAVAGERTAVAEIQQRGDAAGHRQHDHQQQRGVEKRRPCCQGGGDLRQDGQYDGPEHRAQDRAASADQDRNEEQDRQIEGKSVRRDIGLQAREQSAGDGGQRAGEQKDRDQHARFGNADGFRGDFGVADRDQGAAEPAMSDVRAHPGAEGRERDAEIVVAPCGIEGRWKFRTGDADAAAGDALPGQRNLRDDGGEAERRHREIERAQSQGRQADDDSEHGADTARDRQCREYRHRRQDIAGDEYAGDVGAERQQRDIADGEMPGEADDKIEAGDQHPIDCRPGADQRPVVVADERQNHCDREDAEKRRKLRQQRTKGVVSRCVRELR